MQFHILSFEGPDAYSRAGGLASRVSGLSTQLAALGQETHLWFVGDPRLPGHESRDRLHLHRWCQWISNHHPGGVYDGELGKRYDYSESLPPILLRQVMAALRDDKPITFLAEEWHTAPAVLHLDELLRRHGLRHRVRILWNANNMFGFEHVDWARMSEAATLTTVSRYMKHAMHPYGVEPVVIPNGLEPGAFDPVAPEAIEQFANTIAPRLMLAKVARFDPDKRWLATVEIVAELKQRGARPLLVARGGIEAHGREVLARARELGLSIGERHAKPGVKGLMAALQDIDDVDILHLQSHLDPEARRLLFRCVSAVLANSSREPFGLVGLEAMAAHGIACTGISGEDYAVPGHNAIVLQTHAPGEAVAQIERLVSRPCEASEIRLAGATTARNYAWDTVIQRNLMRQVELSSL
jgi:glycosyltransferase involved in cell wall biosynthesis